MLKLDIHSKCAHNIKSNKAISFGQPYGKNKNCICNPNIMRMYLPITLIVFKT